MPPDRDELDPPPAPPPPLVPLPKCDEGEPFRADPLSATYAPVATTNTATVIAASGRSQLAGRAFSPGADAGVNRSQANRSPLATAANAVWTTPG